MKFIKENWFKLVLALCATIFLFPTITFAQCTSENQYNNLRAEYGRSGLLNTEMGINALKNCEEEYKNYILQGQLDKFRQRENEQKLIDDWVDRETDIELNNKCKGYYGDKSLYNYSTKKCGCNPGFIISGNLCVSYEESCRINFGDASYSVLDDKGQRACICKDEYEWDINNKCGKKVSNDNNIEKLADSIINKIDNLATSTSTMEIEKLKARINELENKISSFVEQEKSLIKSIDNKLSESLSGKILLQVENKGEAWYVNPVSKKREYLANGNDAYATMRKSGIGITNSNLKKISANID